MGLAYQTRYDVRPSLQFRPFTENSPIPRSRKMKNQSHNPWPLIRWMAVAVAFALTIGIAWDQVKTKDRELTAANAKIAKMMAGLAEIKKANKEMIGSTSELLNAANLMKTGLEQVKTGLDQRQKDDAKMAALEELGPLLEKRVKIQEKVKALPALAAAIEAELAAATTPEATAAAKAKDAALVQLISDMKQDLLALDARIKVLRIVGELPRPDGS